MTLPPGPYWVEGHTFHKRHGRINNAFRYGMDMVWIDPEAPERSGLAHNRFSLFSFYDADHGFDPGQTCREFLSDIKTRFGLNQVCDGPARLLTQPRFFGYIFNPVSFWFLFDKHDQLRAVLAEVNNTAHGRHVYLCANPDFSVIADGQTMRSSKEFHVSPFQTVSGTYDFRFKLTNETMGVWINYLNDDQGVLTNYLGRFQPMDRRAIWVRALRRPFGAMSVMTRIFWQAAKLKLKGAAYNRAPQSHRTSTDPNRVSR